MQMNSFIILLLLINYICFAFGLCYLVIFLFLDTCDDHIQVTVSKDSSDKIRSSEMKARVLTAVCIGHLSLFL